MEHPSSDETGATPWSRRRFVTAAGAALGLAACARVPSTPGGPRPSLDDDAITVDLHSHAGRVIPFRNGGFDRPFLPVHDAMAQGGMDVICLAIVADTPVTRVDDGRVHAVRDPAPGELYAWSIRAFERARELVERERLVVVTDRAGLRAARGRPSVVIASEGADFLEGRIDRVDEAYQRDGLRHLQLVHYRVNELGDIQTVPRVHDGLTALGRDVVRRCDALGIVVDVAHAPYETVRGVVDATTRPIVLSHTSLNARPGPYSRLIAPAHAKLVASTGGVIGVWPPALRFPTMEALAAGMRDMADVAGVDHVGLGTDLLGLTGPAVFDDYRELPTLRAALGDAGFRGDEIAKLLGGNYARVFDACMRG